MCAWDTSYAKTVQILYYSQFTIFDLTRQACLFSAFPFGGKVLHDKRPDGSVIRLGTVMDSAPHPQFPTPPPLHAVCPEVKMGATIEAV